MTRQAVQEYAAALRSRYKGANKGSEEEDPGRVLSDDRHAPQSRPYACHVSFALH
jgi:hypothetical protein